MAQSKTSSKTAPSQESSDFSEQVAPRLKEGAFIALVAIALYLILALISFDKQDPGWTYTGANEAVNNIVGRSGAWVADVFLFFFGFLAFIFPMMLAWQAWVIFRERESAGEFSWPIFIFKGVGLFLTICAGTGLAAMHFYTFGLDYQYGSGGIVGMGESRRDRAESYAGYRFHHDESSIEATVFPIDGMRQAPISPVDGRPMKRADETAVRRLIEDA